MEPGERTAWTRLEDEVNGIPNHGVCFSGSTAYVCDIGQKGRFAPDDAVRRRSQIRWDAPEECHADDLREALHGNVDQRRFGLPLSAWMSLWLGNDESEWE